MSFNNYIIISIVSIKQYKRDLQIMVRVQSSDGQEFVISKEVARQSVLIQNMLEDVGDEDTAIPLPNVSSVILSKGLPCMLSR